MILTYRYCFPSARILRDTIEDKIGKRILITADPNRIRRLTLRYGNSDPVSCKDTQFNSPEFINLCSDKKTFSDFLLKRNFFCPKFSREAPTKEDYPLIIRTTLNSTGGRGIIVCRNEEEFKNNWVSYAWWTRFIHTSSEYRLHILGGEIKKIQRKIGEDDEEFPIRNLSNGYHFSIRENLEAFPNTVELVNQLNEVLVGKFYSLDIGVERDSKKIFIFEANSASGLNENTAEVYADYLIREVL